MVADHKRESHRGTTTVSDVENPATDATGMVVDPATTSDAAEVVVVWAAMYAEHCAAIEQPKISNRGRSELAERSL